jgi:quercetin dioxygenase-like cupin family protein
MFAINRVQSISIAVLFLLLATVAFVPGRTSAMEENPGHPWCVSGVTVSPIGQAMPEEASGQALVLLRLTIAPGGGFAAHTHPGTLIASIESGTFDLTQLDDMEMSVTRATGESEPMTKGVTLTLDPGDWFVEPGGMVHTGFNNGSEPTTVLLTGVVDPNLPLVQCIEGTPAA